MLLRLDSTHNSDKSAVAQQEHIVGIHLIVRNTLQHIIVGVLLLVVRAEAASRTEVRNLQAARLGDVIECREAVAIAQKVGAKQSWLTHLSHQLPCCSELEKELPAGILPAYDGLTIEA